MDLRWIYDTLIRVRKVSFIDSKLYCWKGSEQGQKGQGNRSWWIHPQRWSLPCRNLVHMRHWRRWHILDIWCSLISSNFSAGLSKISQERGKRSSLRRFDLHCWFCSRLSWIFVQGGGERPYSCTASRASSAERRGASLAAELLCFFFFKRKRMHALREEADAAGVALAYFFLLCFCLFLPSLFPLQWLLLGSIYYGLVQSLIHS